MNDGRFLFTPSVDRRRHYGELLAEEGEGEKVKTSEPTQRGFEPRRREE